jgi:hypothetical protein
VIDIILVVIAAFVLGWCCGDMRAFLRISRQKASKSPEKADNFLLADALQEVRIAQQNETAALIQKHNAAIRAGRYYANPRTVKSRTINT